MFDKKNPTKFIENLNGMDELVNAFDIKQIVVGIFCDFLNAFDTADHDILLQELYHYDICGCAYSWFQSYPAYNIQFVTFHGSKSKSPRDKSNVVSHKAEHSDRYCFYIWVLTF